MISSVEHPRKPVVLFFNPFFGDFPETRGLACERRVDFTHDRSRLAEADAVVFHVPSIPDLAGVPKYPRNNWIAYSKESAVNYPALLEPAFMGKFDLRMTYMRASEIWVSYIPPADAIAALRETPLPNKTGEAVAILMQSSGVNKSGRDAYAAELMRHVSVHSYGKQHRNRQIEGPDEGRKTKLALTARYKFYLAFENSIEIDYVTEKFFDPLIVGTVPVYLGAPNVADFAPGPKSYIDVRDFDTPRDLAAYLSHLEKDEAAYLQYFSWRQTPARRFLEVIQATVTEHPFCRLADLVRQHNAARRPRPRDRPSFPFGGAETFSQRLSRIAAGFFRTRPPAAE